MAIALDYAGESTDISQAEAFIAERTHAQLLIAAKALEHNIKATQKSFERNKNDFRDLAKLAPPEWAPGILARLGACETPMATRLGLPDRRAFLPFGAAEQQRSNPGATITVITSNFSPLFLTGFFS